MSDIDKGEELTDQMLRLIGLCITRWSYVEQRLWAIFTVCTSDVAMLPGGGLNFGDASVATAVFYSAESFRGKLALTNAAALSYLHHSEQWAVDLKREWAKLSDKTRKLSLKRNKLAHYTVLPGFDYDEGLLPPRLVPPYGSPGYFRETGLNSGKQTLTLQHLRHLEYAFCLLEDKLREFAGDLVRQEELFDRYARQLVGRIRSHYRTSQSRAERLKLALSSLK